MLAGEEIKGLIVWSKSQKLKKMHLAGIEFEFSDYAFLEQLAESDVKDQESSSRSTKTMAESGNPEQQSAEDDELLFWSSNP